MPCAEHLADLVLQNHVVALDVGVLELRQGVLRVEERADSERDLCVLAVVIFDLLFEVL